MASEGLNRQNLLVLVRVSVTLEFRHVVAIRLARRLEVARPSTLEILSLFALGEVLEHPVLLNLFVGRELLLKEDERVHLLI